MKSERAYIDYIHDILDAGRNVERFIEGVDFQAFERNIEKAYAVVRGLEIIGEAAGRIPRTFRDRHPEVPWADMIGMRNKVVHEYFGVDLEVVWRTAAEDIPGLLALLEQTIKGDDET